MKGANGVIIIPCTTFKEFIVEHFRKMVMDISAFQNDSIQF